MVLTIIGVAVFIVSIVAMIVASKALPKTIRLVVLIILVELVCVSGVLIAMGLDNMGLMD